MSASDCNTFRPEDRLESSSFHGCFRAGPCRIVKTRGDKMSWSSSEVGPKASTLHLILNVCVKRRELSRKRRRNLREKKFDCSRRFLLFSFCFSSGLILSLDGNSQKKITTTDLSSSPAFASNLQLERRILLVSWLPSLTLTKVVKTCPLQD